MHIRFHAANPRSALGLTAKFSTFFCGLTLCGYSAIAQSPAPGTLDADFNPVLDSASVYAITAQADGKALIGGTFTLANNFRRAYLARLNSNGSLDNSFLSTAGPDNYVRALVVLEDGRIVVGGDFTTIAGASWRGVARLNPDGTRDASFGQFAGVDGQVRATAVQPDGKILLGGTFTHVNGVYRGYLARLNADGSLDNGFNVPTDSTVQTLALRPDGRILVGGEFKLVNNVPRAYLAQLNSSGTLDNGFNVLLDGAVECVSLHTNGQAIVGGWFSKANSVAHDYIVRLNPDGSPDSTFTARCGSVVEAVAIQSNGKLVIGGRFHDVNGATRNHLARLNTNGLLDTEFDAGANADYTVWTLGLESDGKILLGGDFTTIGSIGRTSVARLFGDPPPPLAPGTNTEVQIWHAVEIGWASESNTQYQVQWSSEVTPTLWQNLGQPVAGTGNPISVFDSTRSTPRRFYRVIKLP